MAPKSTEQKERAKALHKQKLEEKRLAKEKAEAEAQSKVKAKAEEDAKIKLENDKNNVKYEDSHQDPTDLTIHKLPQDGEPCLMGIPLDALSSLMSYLPAKELGCLIMTCRTLNACLSETKAHHLYTRLNTHYINLCENASQAGDIIQASLTNGGETKRCITKKSKGKIKIANKACIGSDEYPAYARFIEEAVSGYTVTQFGCPKVVLPKCVNGRIASCSPEHTLSRAYGGFVAGGGGSGVASWGVGNRGQLGHGKRKDEETPMPLLGGIGYQIRIVQVSAGGGLVRVAHSLLLTDLGRVLSFGTGQYGQLGHGWQSGRTLPDETRPRFIEALSRVRVTCVSAGELHSACITEDGDLYTWGDGFCGQLGHGDKRPQLLPKQVIKGEMEDECCLVVSCGNRHTLVNTEDGEVFSFGLGHFGVLGRAFTPYQNHAETALAEVPHSAQGVDTGTSLAQAASLEESDAAFEELYGTSAQVHESSGLQRLPTHEMSDETRAQLHLLSNLTLDDDSDQLIPVKIDVLEDINIVGVSAGHRHRYVVPSIHSWKSSRIILTHSILCCQKVLYWTMRADSILLDLDLQDVWDMVILRSKSTHA